MKPSKPSTMTTFTALLLAAAMVQPSCAFVLLDAPHAATASFPSINVHRSLPLFAFTNGKDNASEDDEDAAAQELLSKAAKLRAEIAKLEGKTLEEVEEEAKTKKDQEKSRIAEQEERKRAQEASADSNDSNDGLSRSEQAKKDGRFVQVPNTQDDMVRQAARATERAFQDGITRQTVRFDLISEDQLVGDENEWPGGAMQMYRESGKPLTTALLREIRAPTKEVEGYDPRIPPTVKQQDLWDFDGSALHTAEAASGASGDVQALVFPNTDVKYINDINTISDAMQSRLFLLVNPFWRNVESWGFNILAPGAKDKAQKAIFDRGFNETYVALSFRARDEKCLALKVYPYDWQLFAYLEDLDYGGPETVIRLGSCETEPTSSLMSDLLNSRPEFKETKTMRQMKKTLGQR